MDKKQITAALDAMEVEYKGNLGKAKLLPILADNLPFELVDLAATAKSRGLDATGDKAQLIDQMGVVVVHSDDGVQIGIADPEPEKHEGDGVKVVCMDENVHLGDGRILRKGDKETLPESLAEFLASRDQVTII